MEVGTWLWFLQGGAKTVLDPTQNRGGGDYTDLPPARVLGTMKAQRIAGPLAARLKGGGGVRHDRSMVEGDVRHTLRGMKMQLDDL